MTRWTTRRPDKPGWYWWKPTNMLPQCVEVIESSKNGRLLVDQFFEPVCDCDGQWSDAPIEEPR